MKKLIVALAALAMLAPSALALGAHYVKVEPKVAEQGDEVRVFGSVGGGCGGPALLISQAFKGATEEEFAGVPAVVAKLHKNFRFSVKVRLSHSVKPGKYSIGGRCGGGNFGSAVLRVKHR